MAIQAGYASGTVLGAPDLDEQARALKNNVDEIYKFVLENIEFIPIHGSQKGALGCLIDGMGGSFDQAELMIELLRRSGYTANFQYGELELTLAEASAWLGTDTANINAASKLLNEGFVPNSVVAGKLRMNHCFVKVNISGTDYVFDPAKKGYATVSGIDMATAMSYNQTTFMNNAKSGSTLTADYVQNMNRANVRSDMTTLTTNLVNWIKTNKHDASVDDIIGGKTITKFTGQLRQTALPYLRPGTTPTTWTSIPDAYKATLHVLYDSPNIDVTFFSKDIHGKRLTITFNASHQAELRLDGTLLATSSAQTPGSWNSVLLEPKHPYSSTACDQSFWMRIYADQPYLIAQAWGNAGPQMIQIHQKKLAQNRFDGIADTDERVVGEMLAAMWHTWDAQNNQQSDIVNKLTGCRTMYHHQVGAFGIIDSVFEDLPGILWKTASLDDVTNNLKTNDNAMAMHGIALEAATIQQMAGVNAVSTTSLIDIANSASDRIYNASSSNWTGTVKPALINYAAQTLTDIENFWINQSWRVAIPRNGSQTKDSWTGYAYYAISPFQGTIGIIDGLKGGSGSQTVTKTNAANATQVNTASIAKEVTTGHAAAGSVDLATGQYSGGTPDISVGSLSYPYSLSFGRSYRSEQRLLDGVLGLGWSHSHQMTASKYSYGPLSFGAESPIQGAAGLAELFVCVDLFKDQTKPIDKWVAMALANQWLIDNLTGNTVRVNFAGESKDFVKLPDGTFAKPLSSTAALVDTGSGVYKVSTLQKVDYNFNSSGQVSTIVFPEGMTVTYSYTAGKLTTVTNGLGRTLTLNYTGSRLTSVTDGTGRSVTFSVNGTTKNLDSATDPNSKSTTYEYGLPGQMTKIFRPANPASYVVLNVYDNLGRIKQQKDAYNNATDFYVAGSRTEVKDALGNSVVHYLNRFGSTIRLINQVGKEWKTDFDGINRQVRVTAPEGNANETVYNANNLVTKSTAKAKPGSGLADLVNDFTYNTTWNKLATAKDARNQTTTYTWNATTGTLTSVQQPTIAEGTPITSFTYNSRGQMLTKTDPTGIVTKINYHATLERIESIVHDEGVGRLNLTTSFGYNTVGDITSVTDPRGKTSTAQFDTLRRQTQTTAPSPLSYITKLSYDDNSNRTKVERETGDIATPWQTTTASFFIDDLLKDVTDPGSQITSFSYTTLRQLWKTTDAASRVVERSYDAAGRLSTVKDPALNTAVTQLYTDNGKIASVKDARNNLTSYEYDGHDRTNKTIYPDSSYEQITSFDANGNPLVLRLRSGNTVTNTFNEVNWLKTKTPQAMATVTNLYDLAGRLKKRSTPVVSGDPSTGDFESFFDTAGRFWKEKYPDGKEVIHQLDANGNATKLTYADGYFIDRVFDEINRLVDVKLNGAATAALHFDYDKLSRRKKLTFGNGVVTDYGFELDDDLNSLVHSFVGSSVTFSYGYNNIHELTTQTVSDNQFMWNPLTSFSTTYGTANNLNQYPAIAGTSVSYNSNGCLTGDGIWSYSFDTENHLTSASKPGVSASYLYDPLHRQAQKTVGSTKTRFIYAGLQRIADYDGTSGSLQNRYVFGSGLDEPLIQISAGGTLTYMHQDKTGSIIATTNSAGAVTNRYRYSPWGEASSLSGTTFGFQGQRYDSETGLCYMKARYYDPRTGRFLQPDPMGYSAGLNLYLFANNNPLDLTDPLGLSPSAGSGVIVPDLQGLANQSITHYETGWMPPNYDMIGGFDIRTELGRTYYQNADGSITPGPTMTGAIDNVSLHTAPNSTDILMTHNQLIGSNLLPNNPQFRPGDYQFANQLSTTYGHNVYMWTINDARNSFIYVPSTGQVWKLGETQSTLVGHWTTLINPFGAYGNGYQWGTDPNGGWGTGYQFGIDPNGGWGTFSGMDLSGGWGTYDDTHERPEGWGEHRNGAFGTTKLN
jgi:RHS repeat-associated protein